MVLVLWRFNLLPKRWKTKKVENRILLTIHRHLLTRLAGLFKYVTVSSAHHFQKADVAQPSLELCERKSLNLQASGWGKIRGLIKTAEINLTDFSWNELGSSQICAPPAELQGEKASWCRKGDGDGDILHQHSCCQSHLCAFRNRSFCI